MRRPAPSTVRWGLLVLLLVLWEALPQTGLIPELFVPSLTKTLRALWRSASNMSTACWSPCPKWASPW